MDQLCPCQTSKMEWTFTPTSHLCSEHFRPEDFESQFSAVHGTSFVGRWS